MRGMDWSLVCAGLALRALWRSGTESRSNLETRSVERQLQGYALPVADRAPALTLFKREMARPAFLAVRRLARLLASLFGRVAGQAAIIGHGLARGRGGRDHTAIAARCRRTWRRTRSNTGCRCRARRSGRMSRRSRAHWVRGCSGVCCRWLGCSNMGRWRRLDCGNVRRWRRLDCGNVRRWLRSGSVRRWFGRRGLGSSCRCQCRRRAKQEGKSSTSHQFVRQGHSIHPLHSRLSISRLRDN
jgi:hypothetical protein